MILLSVVVCTYNRSRFLSACLDSLSEQTLVKELYEVIVVNNNSTDNTHDVASNYINSNPNFRLLSEPLKGLSHARNCGWRNARGEYVAYIDDDAKATTDWCKSVLHAFRNVSPRPAVVGGPILAWYEAVPPVWFKEEYESFSWGDRCCFLESPGNRLGFCGSNMAFRKDILKQVGGFSAEYGMKGAAMGMGEETELFYRLSAENATLWYDPTIIVRHWVPEWKFSITYRFKRNFMAGRTMAMIEKPVFGQLQCMRELFFLMVKVITFIPYALNYFAVAGKAPYVRKLQELACRLGYLSAMGRNRKSGQ